MIYFKKESMKQKWVSIYDFPGLVLSPQSMLYNIKSEKKYQEEAEKNHSE